MAKKKKRSTKDTKTQHPDHTAQLPRLNRVEGQIVGVKRMIEEGRYCPHIIQQVRATRKALAAVEATLLEEHLHNCVRSAFEQKSMSERNKKVQEILTIFKSAGSQGIDL